MSINVQDIPDTLIYEMDEGKPVYYQGYQEVLSKQKDPEEVMGSSYLQALLATKLVLLLGNSLDLDQYELIAQEIGLKFSDQSWRAADLAIFNKESLENVTINNRYLEVPPKVVIEIDTKASLKETEAPLSYYQRKTDQLLDFGVEQVVWIFTDTEKVMIAESGKKWSIQSWELELDILGIAIKISDLLV